MNAREVTIVTSPSAPVRHFSLAGQPAAAEALRVADDGVDLGVLDCLENPRGLLEVCCQRLLDQHRNSALDRPS
jgi:hypothetical protein